MLDAAFVRDHLDAVRAAMQNRGVQTFDDLEELAKLEVRRRTLIPEHEGLKREQNAAADEVARAKRQGQDASGLFARNKERGQRIKQLEIELAALEENRKRLLLNVPNVPHAVGAGGSERGGQPARCAAGASRAPSTSSRRRTGTSARSSASSTSSGRPRSPARASRCSGRLARGSSARSSTSCSTCTRASTATPRCCRRSS